MLAVHQERLDCHAAVGTVGAVQDSLPRRYAGKGRHGARPDHRAIGCARGGATALRRPSHPVARRDRRAVGGARATLLDLID